MLQGVEQTYSIYLTRKQDQGKIYAKLTPNPKSTIRLILTYFG